MAISFLNEVNSEKDKWSIKVKVVSLWKQYYINSNPPALASMDMIFKDEQGTTIHATIRAGFISDFDKLLQENADFLITNFNVKKNNDGTKLTPHQYKLHFVKKTNVRHCQDFTCDTDDDGLQLISFHDFNNTTFDTAYAFDVIGRLINNKDITVLNGKNGSTKSSLEFELQDLKGDTIRCILWNDLAEKLHKYIKDNEHSEEPVIVLIIMAKYSSWNDVIQVSNCFYGTKVLINENNPRIIDFKTSFLGTELARSEDTKIQLSTSTIYKNPEESYTRFPVKNIEELYEISEK